MEDESPPTVTGDNPNQVLPKVEPSPSVPLGTLRALDGDVPDETTAARGEEVWSKEHPPVIFGMLDPPDTLRSIKHQTPGNIYNDNRRKVEGTDGAPLRDLPNLPRYISSKNEPVEMEFFFRADPRLGYNDIRSRQQEWRAYNNKKYKTSKAKKGGNPLRRPNNGINNARRRAVRGPLVMRDWSVKHEGKVKVYSALLDMLIFFKVVAPRSFSSCLMVSLQNRSIITLLGSLLRGVFIPQQTTNLCSLISLS